MRQAGHIHSRSAKSALLKQGIEHAYIKRPSDTQMHWLDVMAGHNPIYPLTGAYNPSISEDRTFNALVDRNMVEWKDGRGYVLTKVSREAVRRFSKFGAAII